MKDTIGITERYTGVIVVICLVACGIAGYWSFVLYHKQQALQTKIALLEIRQEEAAHYSPSRSVEQPLATQVNIESSVVWRRVQENVQDTVVQIFSQIAEADLFQPYKTPSQYSATGSGFFINEEGELVTNAHVVDQARSVWVQIPSLGKRIIEVDVVGVSPERDLALLRVTEEDRAFIQKTLGKVPFLALGDSDSVMRADDVMALGYPLSQQALKSTTGVVSGREHHLIQISAAINPGNSGGPLLDTKGNVVGVNSLKVTEADNVGYAIPINDLVSILPDLRINKLLRKPYLGVLFNNATDYLTDYLGNPQPGGCYVVEVSKGSPLEHAGVKRGDMLYEVNGHRLDIYGEMNVPWSEDKISIVDYVARLKTEQDVHIVVYRNGERKEVTTRLSEATLPAIRRVYPGYEPMDYEVFAGMVVMPLTINHIMAAAARAPGLARYTEMNNQQDPVLLVTHIFPNSTLARTRTITPGSTLNEINGKKVTTLQELREAIQGIRGSQFITLRASDNVARSSDNVFVVLPLDKVLSEERRLASDYKYALSDTVKSLVQGYEASQLLAASSARTAVSA